MVQLVCTRGRLNVTGEQVARIKDVAQQRCVPVANVVAAILTRLDALRPRIIDRFLEQAAGRQPEPEGILKTALEQIVACHATGVGYTAADLAGQAQDALDEYDLECS